MATQENIGRVIKRIRKELKWTQDRLCEATENAFEPSHLSRIENGLVGLTLNTIETLSKALCTTTFEIMREAEGLAQAEIKPPTSNYCPLLAWDEIGKPPKKRPIQPELDPNWLHMPDNCGLETFALRVLDDAMASGSGVSFPEGTIIFVDPQQSKEQSIFSLVKLNQETEPYLRKTVSSGGKTYLRPLNPQYPTETATTETIICGAVVDVSFQGILKI